MKNYSVYIIQRITEKDVPDICFGNILLICFVFTLESVFWFHCR